MSLTFTLRVSLSNTRARLRSVGKAQKSGTAISANITHAWNEWQRMRE
jgi:hypothetical protein